MPLASTYSLLYVPSGSLGACRGSLLSLSTRPSSLALKPPFPCWPFSLNVAEAVSLISRPRAGSYCVGSRVRSWAMPGAKCPVSASGKCVGLKRDVCPTSCDPFGYSDDDPGSYEPPSLVIIGSYAPGPGVTSCLTAGVSKGSSCCS